MNGITVDTFEAFESLTEILPAYDFVLQTDAEIVSRPSFGMKYAKLSRPGLVVRNPVPPRLNRLILDSTFKLQMDYLESFGREIEKYRRYNVEKILLDFDLPSVLQDDEKCRSLQKILASLKGIVYSEHIEIELLFRLPFNDMESFIAPAAFFRQQSIIGLNYAVDLHIHEAGFDRDELAELLLPLQFDIGTVNFVYDAALGNKINPQNLKKIMTASEEKGINCNFFLAPSGSINFQSIREDLLQWMEII